MPADYQGYRKIRKCPNDCNKLGNNSFTKVEVKEIRLAQSNKNRTNFLKLVDTNAGFTSKMFFESLKICFKV